MLDWLKKVWLSPSPADPGTAQKHTATAATVTEAWSVLSNVNEWVKHAETKLGVVLAFLGVLAAGLITLIVEVGQPSTLMAWIEGVTGGLLLLASACATVGLLPQFAHEPDQAKLNPLYYGDVSRYFAKKAADFSGHLQSTLNNPSDATDEIARQIVANSVVAVRKYTWANRAICLGFLALLGTVGVVVGLALCW